MLKKIRDKMTFLRWAYDHWNEKPQEIVKFTTTNIRPVHHCVKVVIDKNMYGPFTGDRVEKDLMYLVAKRICADSETIIRDLGNDMVEYRKEWWYAKADAPGPEDSLKVRKNDEKESDDA